MLAACAPARRAAPPAVAAPLDTAGASAVAESWWRAFTLGDTAYLARHTAPALALTLSSGRSLDRATMLREAAAHVPKPSTFVQPATDVELLPVAGAVVVTSRVVEGSQGGANEFRYLAVLERADGEWRVAAAHSTRRLALTPRVPAGVAGTLGDFAGAYRTPRGGLLRVVVRDSALVMIDPSGAESRLEPIGPALFELPALYDGIAVVRFAFTRYAGGRMATMSRMIHGSVATWPREP